MESGFQDKHADIAIAAALTEWARGILGLIRSNPAFVSYAFSAPTPVQGLLNVTTGAFVWSDSRGIGLTFEHAAGVALALRGDGSTGYLTPRSELRKFMAAHSVKLPLTSMTVELPAKGDFDLVAMLRQAEGLVVRFDNGCWISLEEEAGMHWGTDPYGCHWCCQGGGGWERKVAGWLRYWNEPRDERGRPAKLESEGRWVDLDAVVES